MQRHMKITAQTHFKLLLTSNLPTAHWSKASCVASPRPRDREGDTPPTEAVRRLNIFKTIMLPTIPTPTEVRFSKGI